MSACVLASASMLKQQQDWELNWEGVSGAGWRALQHECGLTYQNPVTRRRKAFFFGSSPPLGKLQVIICLPRSVPAFFIACLLLGRGIVCQVQILDISQI